MSVALSKWLKKANSDIKICIHEIQHEDPVTDVICFHAQQAVEKYLKAYLIYNDKEILKTHDLSKLIYECSQVNPEFQQLFDNKIDILTRYATSIRYPDDFYIPTIDETKIALEKMYYSLEFVKKQIGIKELFD
jgi:HEPN domain-containing protein